MPLSKKELNALKQKMKNSNPAALNNIRQNSSSRNKATVKKVIKKESYKQPKSIVRWNFKENQLVKLDYEIENCNIGLIVSDYEYFSSRVEKNCFFVLVKNTVRQIDGRYLRSL